MIFEKKGRGGIVGRFSRCSNQPMAVLDVSQEGREGGRDFVAAHPFRLLFANAAETNERAPGLGE